MRVLASAFERAASGYTARMSTLPTIGFIGLGIMGRPMCGHLLAAGYPLRVHTRTPATARALCDQGAIWRDTPAALAADCDFVLLNVPDTTDARSVLFGANGAAATLRPGTIVIDHSTINPQATRRFARRLARQRVHLLDAPVTGGERGAQDATLTILVGGARKAFERARPVLERLGRKIVYVGRSGAGQETKACNQILVAVNMMGVCEALAFAQRCGLDLTHVIETLAEGAGGSWAWTHLGAKIARDDLLPAFMIQLMQKDLRIVQETAAQHTTPLPAVALAQQMFRTVEDLPDGARLGTQALALAYPALRARSRHATAR